MLFRSIADVSLRDLEIFVMASRTQSLREVARQMDLLPAHTSKIIKGLERKLGTQLFKRSAAGIMLTPEGLEALEIAERICEISREMSPQAGQRQSQTAEKLWTCGSIGFLATYILSPAICRFQASSKKNLRFRLVEFTHNDLVGLGLKGAFEIAMHIEELEWTSVWESYLLGKLKWKLYGRRDHPLQNGCSENEVLKYRFIVPTDWGTRGYQIGEDFCPLPVRRRLKGNEATTAETALEICSHSDQLTFVPEVLANKWCATGAMKSIEVADWPVQDKDIYLSVRADLVPRSIAENFLKLLKTFPEFD